MALIALTTDFGTRDGYAAAMKGVLLSLAPKATLVDVTHEIEPYDILHGAFVLRQVWPYYPLGTIHVAIVDPGVGSDRRILLAQYSGQWVLAPDNGLLTFLHRDTPPEELRVVEDRKYFLPTVSSTFHGRDVFAPVAAHLANGVKPREFGRPADRIELLTVPHRAESVGDGFRGRVLFADRFGSLITNIRQEQLAAPRIHSREWRVSVNGLDVGPVRSAYAQSAPGEPLALWGSAGYLEIAVNQGRAAQRFGDTQSIEVSVE